MIILHYILSFFVYLNQGGQYAYQLFFILGGSGGNLTLARPGQDPLK
jgi:hypothetical protein